MRKGCGPARQRILQRPRVFSVAHRPVGVAARVALASDAALICAPWSISRDDPPSFYQLAGRAPQSRRRRGGSCGYKRAPHSGFRSGSGLPMREPKPRPHFRGGPLPHRVRDPRLHDEAAPGRRTLRAHVQAVGRVRPRPRAEAGVGAGARHERRRRAAPIRGACRALHGPTSTGGGPMSHPSLLKHVAGVRARADREQCPPRLGRDHLPLGEAALTWRWCR
jgi:hypothetical protein